MQLPRVPSDIHWMQKPLPDVNDVSAKSRILAWIIYDYPNSQNEPYKKLHGRLKRITMILPWGNDLNPVQWCDGDLPIGLNEKVEYWAWLFKEEPEPRIDWRKEGL